MTAVLNTSGLRDRLTLTVPEAGALLGVGRDAAYDAAAAGQIPAMRVGRRLVVPTHALLAKLGWSDQLIAQAIGVTETDEAEGDEAANVHELPSSLDPGHAPPADPAA